MSWTPTLDPGVFIPVRTKDDLPDAVAGVITLPAGTSYQFDGTVDLQGDRLLCAGIVTLAGTSSETARVCSTGLVGGALVTSAYSLPMQNLAFFNCTASVFDLDASANPDQALDWRAVNFVDCPSVGTLKGYGNIIYDSGAFLNASGLVLDGAIQTFGFQSSLLDLHNGAVNPGIRFLNTCTIMRRFRSIFSSFVALPGEVGIQVDDQATFVNNESFILETDNFSGGGTYLSGIDATSNKSLIISCVGVENSADIGDYGMTNNAVITPIAAANTFVKVLGTTVDGDFVAKFDQTIDNRSTYVGFFGTVLQNCYRL